MIVEEEDSGHVKRIWQEKECTVRQARYIMHNVVQVQSQDVTKMTPKVGTNSGVSGQHDALTCKADRLLTVESVLG